MTAIPFDPDEAIDPADFLSQLRRATTEEGFEDAVITQVANDQLTQEIEKMLSVLTPQEREIFRLRMGLDRGQPRTLQEIGDQLGLTRQCIQQIEVRAMAKLRQ